MALGMRFGFASERELEPGVPVGEIPVFWVLSVVVCALGAWFSGGQSRESVLLASPLLLLGGLTALWAVRTLGKARELVRWGPYAWVRHPYFLSILIMVLGAIGALRSWPALLLFMATVKVTVDRARREEHNLAIRFGEAFEAYRREVPFLLPLTRGRRARPTTSPGDTSPPPPGQLP